jgi:S1-C subfamily serine protease
MAAAELFGQRRGRDRAEAKRVFSGMFSQAVVVCLLALFIVVTLIAMFTTAGVSTELGWIGMTAKGLEPETAAALGIPSDAGGVVVDEVEGIAQKAGIRHGDVLVGINGEPIHDMVDFSLLAGKTDLSKRGAQIDVIRKGLRIPVFVLPSRRGVLGMNSNTPPGGTPPGAVEAQAIADQRWLGADVEAFPPGEGRELGIPAGVGGVLIEGVRRGGVADQAGLAANDVVVSVNGRRVEAPEDLWNALARLNGADWIELGVYRHGLLTAIGLPPASGTLAGGFPGRPGGPVWAEALPGPRGWGLGPGGFLVCPSCGTEVAHQRGVPCFTVPCPSCGTMMTRLQ